MLIIQDLTFHYPGDSEALLQIPHWQIEKGESVFLSAPSGSGKSTLMNLIAGVILPQKGTITVMGTEINHLSGRQRDAFRAHHIGMVFQKFNLIPYLSAIDNIRLASHFSEQPATEIDHNIDHLLNKLGLSKADSLRPAGQLSVGQQQRVAIIRALINRPNLLLVDEPTSALDTAHRDQFIDVLMQQIDTSDTSLLFVSHDTHLATHFDRHVTLKELSSDVD